MLFCKLSNEALIQEIYKLIARIENQEKEIEKFREEIGELNGEIGKLNGENGKLKEENNKLKKDKEKLKQEISRLKGLSQRPKIEPSILEKNPIKKAQRKNNKSSKIPNLKIDKIEKVFIDTDKLPEGAMFKGFRKKVVQELIIKKEATKYLLAQYQLPNGKYIAAKLPEAIGTWSFGPQLRSYIVYQHSKNRVPQEKILEELLDKGIYISAGEVNRILEEVACLVQNEKEELLNVGIQMKHIQVDDTGTRHKFQNGFVTVICNDFFTYFKSSKTKSRVNFLEILRGEHKDYVFTQESVNYIRLSSKSKRPKNLIDIIEKNINREFATKGALDKFLQNNEFAKESCRLITEAALIGSLITHGFDSKTVILSDDAGQFNIFKHALCWIHAERALKALVPLNDNDKIEINEVQDQLWNYYQELKEYKLEPSAEKKEILLNRFDTIFGKYPTEIPLTVALRNILNNKEELLRVLDYPNTPLHNNLSESDIREFVIKRKISAGTRSDKGREARDTFISLIKTCKKNKVSYWTYINDRVHKNNNFPFLPNLILQRYNHSLSP